LAVAGLDPLRMARTGVGYCSVRLLPWLDMLWLVVSALGLIALRVMGACVPRHGEVFIQIRIRGRKERKVDGPLTEIQST
jgi:hypothetical protein